MTIQELHYEIKLAYNKIDSNHKKDLAPAQIDRIINKSQLELVNLIYAGDKTSNMNVGGFESTQLATDLISILTVKQPDQPKSTPDNIDLLRNVYEFKFKNLKYPYLDLIRLYLDTDCKNMSIGKIYQSSHDDLSMILTDAMTQPSKQWRRAIASIGKDSTDPTNSSVYIYTGGEFKIYSIDMEYLRQPKKVFFGGYDTLEYLSGDSTGYQSTDPPVDCEFPNRTQYLLVDIVVKNIAKILSDGDQVILTKQEIVNSI